MLSSETIISEYEIFYDGLGRTILSAEYASDFLNIRFEYRGGIRYDLTFNAKTLVVCGEERSDYPIRLRKKARSVIRDAWSVRIGHTDWGKNDWIDISTHLTLADAQDTLKSHRDKLLETDSPFLIRLKKFAEAADVYDYDQWAEARFQTGEWMHVPWANEPWVKPDLLHHFAHIAKGDDTRVAFWVTPERAQNEDVEVVAAGRYLQRFYCDVLTPQEIELWGTRMDPPGDLVFSGPEPEAIYEAYNSADAPGLHSCMAYRDDQRCHDSVLWRSGKNPVRVYGAGDLEVVTLMRQGRKAARALCWPAKKVYGRCYGDSGNVQRIMAALNSQGWTHDGNGVNNMDVHGNGGFNGARLLKLRPEDYPANWIMPYVDFNYRVRDAGDHFELNTSDGDRCWRTDGLKYEAECDADSDLCERCDDPIGDEAHTVDGEEWCSYCWSEYTYSCCRCGHTSSCSMTNVGDSSWCNGCVERYSAECSDCDEIHPTSMISVVRDHGDNSIIRRVCSDCAVSESLTRIDGTLYSTETIVEEDEHEPA